MNRLVFFALLLLQNAVAGAAPVISSVSGAVTDNQTVVIDGSGFGSNNLKIEWLGGSSGAIESILNTGPFLNSAHPGWSEDSELGDSHIDTRRAWSGSRSLVFDPVLSRYHDGRFGLIYDNGNNFSELYTSYMVYFDNGGASGQWKMIRWCYRNSVVDDARPNAYMANWENGPADFLQLHGGNDATKWFTSRLPLSGAWYRVETFMRPSSQPTASDGEFWVRSTRTTDNQVQTEHFTGLKTYDNGETNRFRYVVFQNYLGNGYNNSTKVWMDDIYISQTQARVELCPSATWAQCHKGEVQVPTSWTGNRINIKLNKGGLSTLSGTYLYVVDGSGTANANGYALSGSGPQPAIPEPPTDVQVQ